MPRLTYSGDTTDLFGKFLPTPVFDGIKIKSISPSDQDIVDAARLYRAISGPNPDINLANAARLEVKTSLMFNSDDSFTPEEYFNTLLTNGVDNSPSLYLNIIAIKESDSSTNLINQLKNDKLNLSNIRTALDSISVNTARYHDLKGTPTDITSDLIVNDLLNRTVYQVYSIPYSTNVANYSYTSDYDEDGNPIFNTGNITFSFLISDFKILENVSIFACLSTRDIKDISLQSRAMFTLNFGDISYEDVKIAGKVAKFGDAVYLDSNSLVYPSMPLMALDSKFYKTDNVSKLDLNKSLDPIIQNYSKFMKNDKSLKRQIDNIIFVRQKYFASPELLPNLQKANKLSPSKSPNNNIGRMYDEIRIVINNFNVALLGEQEVVKRIFRNNKILDLRDLFDLEFIGSYDQENETNPFIDRDYIYKNKLHSNVAKYVPVSDTMNWPGQAELPVTSAELRDRTNERVSRLKQKIFKLFEESIANSVEDIDIGSQIDDANRWVQGFVNFWSGRLETLEAQVRDTQIGNIEFDEYIASRTTNSQVYYVKEDSLDDLEDDLDRDIDEDDVVEYVLEQFSPALAPSPYSPNEDPKALSYGKMDELYAWQAGSSGRIQLIFPNVIERGTVLPTIGTTRKDHVDQANTVAAEYDLFEATALTLDVPIGGSKKAIAKAVINYFSGNEQDRNIYVVGMLIRGRELFRTNDGEIFKENLQKDIVDFLTANDNLLEGDLDSRGELQATDLLNSGLQYRFIKIRNSIVNSFKSKINDTIDEIVNDPNLLTQLLQENERDNLASQIFDKLKRSLKALVNSNLSSDRYTAVLATPYNDYKYAGKTAKAKLIKTGDDDNKGVIYGKYQNLDDRFQPGYASGGSMWYHKIDLAGSLKESIRSGFSSLENEVENLIENILEEVLQLESINMDVRLFDKLANTDIIIQKSGYFFFDYEKFVRRRSFISRYIDVGRLVDFSSQGKEITNASIKLDRITYFNKTYNTQMELKKDRTMPQNPVEYESFSFFTSRAEDGKLLSYPRAPLSTVLSFDDFFNTTPVAAVRATLPVGAETVTGIESVGPVVSTATGPKSVDAFSQLVQRNFNFTNFNDGLLREGITWKDDYRLNLFQYKFFIDDDRFNRATSDAPTGIVRGPTKEGHSRDLHTITIKIEDDSYLALIAIIDTYDRIYTNFKKNYYDLALEQCSYNEYSERFNDFFVSAIKEKFPGILNPWAKMVSMYVQYINMFTNSFEGSYVEMVDFGEKMLNSIRPETGTLDRLVSVNDAFASFNNRLQNLKNLAEVDYETYSRTQVISIDNDIERGILDHIADHSVLSNSLEPFPDPPESL